VLKNIYINHYLNRFQVDKSLSSDQIETDPLSYINNSDEDECGICLDDMGCQYVKLQCGHNFHHKCIESWFRCGDSASCPFCKREYTDAILELI